MKYKKFMLVKTCLRIVPSIIGLILAFTILTGDYESLWFPICWIATVIISFLIIDCLIILICFK